MAVGRTGAVGRNCIVQSRSVLKGDFVPDRGRGRVLDRGSRTPVSGDPDMSLQSADRARFLSVCWAWVTTSGPSATCSRMAS